MNVDRSHAERISPIPPGQWTALEMDAVREYPSPDGKIPNLLATLARHPDLCRAWLVLSGVLLRKGQLSARDREIIILRIAWRSQSVYEWRQHWRQVDEATLNRLSQDVVGENWDVRERLLVRTVDEYCNFNSVDDAIWTPLASLFTEQQLLEIVFLCSHYFALASTLRIVGVQPESSGPAMPAAHAAD